MGKFVTKMDVAKEHEASFAEGHQFVVGDKFAYLMYKFRSGDLMDPKHFEISKVNKKSVQFKDSSDMRFMFYLGEGFYRLEENGKLSKMQEGVLIPENDGLPEPVLEIYREQKAEALQKAEEWNEKERLKRVEMYKSRAEFAEAHPDAFKLVPQVLPDGRRFYQYMMLNSKDPSKWALILVHVKEKKNLFEDKEILEAHASYVKEGSYSFPSISGMENNEDMDEVNFVADAIREVIKWF